MFDQTVNFRTQTNGNGYWSSKKKFVTINRIELAYVDEEEQFGELRAYFDPKEWDVDNDGLIYSDMGWKRSFLTCLETLGFSTDAILHVSYSEQGMQGVNYVSMDVQEDFIRECNALYRFIIHKQAVNM
jgi:hypothetical protein